MNTELALRTAIADFPTDPLPFLAYLDYLEENQADKNKIAFYKQFMEAFNKGIKYRHNILNTWYLIYHADKVWYIEINLNHIFGSLRETDLSYDNICCSKDYPNLKRAKEYEAEGTWIQF